MSPRQIWQLAAPSHYNNNNNRETWRQDDCTWHKGGEGDRDYRPVGVRVALELTLSCKDIKKHIPGGCTLAGDRQMSAMRQQDLK